MLFIIKLFWISSTGVVDEYCGVGAPQGICAGGAIIIIGLGPFYNNLYVAHFEDEGNVTK